MQVGLWYACMVSPSSDSDVQSSRPSCPRGQNFVLGLGLEDLSSASDSASSICPRPVLELFILAHWRQRRRGCRGHIPSNILVGGDVNGNIPTNIITYVRIQQTNISRPRPMTAFNGVFLFIVLLKNPKFATEST